MTDDRNERIDKACETILHEVTDEIVRLLRRRGIELTDNGENQLYEALRFNLTVRL